MLKELHRLPSIWFEWHYGRYDGLERIRHRKLDSQGFSAYHSNVQRSTQIDRGTRGGVGVRGDKCRNETHDSVAANGNTVATGTMGAGKYLRSVCIELRNC